MKKPRICEAFLLYMSLLASLFDKLLTIDDVYIMGQSMQLWRTIDYMNHAEFVPTKVVDGSLRIT